MPTHREHRFLWTFDLASPPEALWPLVSNTDRFNRDCGYPAVTVVPPTPNDPAPLNNSRRLRATVMGVVFEWDELAFEWSAPTHYAVERVYRRGPLAKMVVACDLRPRASGGTALSYELRITAASLLGRVALPFSIGRNARAATERVFRRYDEFAQRGRRRSELAQKPALSAGGAQRLTAVAQVLVTDAGQPGQLVNRLIDFIRTADDLAVAKIRPYVLADDWNEDRRAVLQLLLHATRGGLVDFSWDLICPHCRGAKASQRSLTTLRPTAHCDSCHVDFTANFDQSVELTFTPNAAVRAVTRAEYCVGGPQVTPHILAQLRLPSASRRPLRLALAEGRYRVRAPGVPFQHAFRVAPGAAPVLQLELGTPPAAEASIAPQGELSLANSTGAEQLTLVEHLAWTDQATTAAEVTSLQLFRDLFSREVLRPGERISVGAMTIVFTDLKNSTQMYQEIGDAPAFGRVLTHFELLKAAVADENGCIVKTMGDAIMAVFPRPVAAVRAMVHAQRWLAAPARFPLPPGVTVPPSSLQPLALKAGIHCGPCLAINQNDRLDYFGTTVNLTARLCGLCSGLDLVLSHSVCADPEVTAYINAGDPVPLRLAPEKARLKGFGELSFDVWRISRA